MRCSLLGFALCLSSLAGCGPSRAAVAPASSSLPPSASSVPVAAARPAHDLGDRCEADVLARARSLDLRTEAADGFFRERFNASDAKSEACAREIVHVLSERIDASAAPSVRDGYYGAVASFARRLPKDTVAAVEEAYRRIGFDATSYRAYFLGLRATGIDLREFLRARVGKDDWASFSGPRANATENATTWDYYVYLASLETPGALEAIEKKVRATKSGNDVANLLRDLAELKSTPARAGARRVIASFANDPRRTDGPDGPGAKLSELVPLELQFFDR